MNEPMYRALARKLEQRIAEEELTHLPPGRELRDEYGVSMTTVREAIRLLVRSGLVQTHTSQGTRVIRHPRRLVERRISRPWPDFLPSEGEPVDPRARVTVSREAAPQAIYRRLGGHPDTQYCRREALLNGDIWVISYYPIDLIDDGKLESQLSLHDVRQRLHDAGHMEQSWVDEYEIRASTAEEAQAFGVHPGADIGELLVTGATDHRLLRVSHLRMAAERQRLVHAVGNDAGLSIIQQARESHDEHR